MRVVTVFYLAHFLFTRAVDGNHDSDKERVLNFARQWAPKIWLHPQEKFYPLNVSTFLNEVTLMESKNCKNCLQNADRPLKRTGAGDHFLVTKKDRDCLLRDKLSFLYGAVPSRNVVVSVYAFVTVCEPSLNHFSITYWFFYPFNEGKNICTLRLGKASASVVPAFKVFEKCLGKAERYGNHVGDWERMTLDVKNWTPSSIFLSVHSVGVYYVYDKLSHSFVLTSTPAKGVSQVQQPPPIIRLLDNHPLLFSAKGSHALWGSPGSYLYMKLKLSQLMDEVDYGTAWETWRDLQLFFTQKWTPGWYKYGGKWGNPRSGCLGKTNVCFFSDGPDGLSNRPKDFKCRSSF